MTACTFCGRANDPASRFCVDCGKALSAAGAARACPACARPAGALPFCGHCGAPVGAGAGLQTDDAIGSVRAPVRPPRTTGPRLALLDPAGEVSARFSLDRGDAVVGRGDADIRLEDVYLSPLHARLELRADQLWVRDLGSRNGTWTFIEEAACLADGDVILIGSQIIRFRRLGYPGPRAPDADATRRMGSVTPSADVAVLEQLRADASVRDRFHLSPARDVFIGRESGDWLFPYDQTMSGRHAEIRSQDADFFVRDCGSRNGVALAVRGERAVRTGQRVLVGDQILRIESVTT